MPDAGTTALIGTALGGLIAGGAGWLNGMAQSRRERRREHIAVRRAAFAEFLRTTDASLATIHDQLDRMLADAKDLLMLEGPSDEDPVLPPTFVGQGDAERLKGCSRDALHALNVVDLCASPAAARACWEYRAACEDLFLLVLRMTTTSPPRTVAELLGPAGEASEMRKKITDDRLRTELLRAMQKDLDG